MADTVLPDIEDLTSDGALARIGARVASGLVALNGLAALGGALVWAPRDSAVALGAGLAGVAICGCAVAVWRCVGVAAEREGQDAALRYCRNVARLPLVSDDRVAAAEDFDDDAVQTCELLIQGARAVVWRADGVS